jgi:hypothetical protein
MLFSGNGFMECQFTTTGVGSVGLNSGLPAQVRADLEFAFSTNGTNIVEVREAGTYRGDTSYTASDVFRIEISGNQVLYKKNGVTFQTSTPGSLGYPFRAEATLITPGVRVANAKMSSSTAPALANLQGDPSRAAALESGNFLAGPFPLVNDLNFSTDRKTRIMLFAVNFDLLPTEDFHNVVGVQLRNQQGSTFNLPVEYVGKIPGYDWLTTIVVRLDEQVVDVGNLTVTVSLRGIATEGLVITTRP